MRFTAMVLILVASLAGCAQYDETRNANLAAASQDQVAVDDAKCKSSGLQPNSAEYEDCRKRLAEQNARGTRGYQRMLNVMENDRGGRPFGQ